MAANDYSALRVYVTADTRQLASGIASAASTAGNRASASLANTIGRASRAVGRTLATGIGTAVVATAGLGTAAVRAGFQYNVLSQTSLAAFKTILGSGEAAKQMMADIGEFASTSPFPRQAFIEAGRTMVAFGIEAKKTVPYLSAIQDAVAATGGSAQDIGDISFVLSQISAAGKITATDLMQLGQRGINAAELIGASMGKTGPQIKEAITKGTLDADDALDALVAGMGKKFGGAAANVRQTWVGATDRIRGAMRDIGSAIVEPFVSREGGGMAVEWANKLADIFRALQVAVGPVFRVIGQAIAGPLTRAGPLLDRTRNSIDFFGRVTAQTDKFQNSLKRMLPVIGALATGFGTFASKGLLGAIPGLGGFAGALNPVLAGLGALVALSPGLRTAIGNFVGQLKPALGPIQDVGSALSGALVQAVQRLGPAFTTIGNNLAPVITDLVSRLAPAITTVIDAVMRTNGPFDTFVNLLVSASGVVSALTPVITLIANAVGVLATGFAKLPGPIQLVVVGLAALKFTQLGSQITGFASKLGGSLINNFRNFGEQMRVQQALAAQAGQPIGRLGAAMATAGAQAGAAAKGGFNALVGALGGPMGIAMAGVTIGLGFLANQQQKAKQAAQEHKAAIEALTGQLEQSNGVIDANVRSSLAKTAADTGVLDTLDKLGLSQSEYFTALMSGEPAMKAYAQRAKEAAEAQGLTGFEALQTLAPLTNQMDTVLDASDAWGKQSEALKSAGDAAGITSPAIQTLTDSMKTFGDTTQDATTRSNALATALLALSGGGLDANQVAIQQADSFRSLNQAFANASTANEKLSAAFKGNSTTMDTSSAAASTLDRTMRSDLAPAFANTIRQAFDAAGGYENYGEAVLAAQAEAQKYTGSLTAQLKQMGLTEKQAQALIKQYGLVPSKVSTVLAAENLRQTGKSIDDLRKKYGDLPEKKLLELYARDLTAKPVRNAQKQVDGLKSKVVDLAAKNMVGQPRKAAQAEVDKLLGRIVDLSAANKTGPGKKAAQEEINRLKGKLVDLIAVNKTPAAKRDAQRTIDQLLGKTVDLNAYDKVSAVVRQAQQEINDFSGKTVTVGVDLNMGMIQSRLQQLPPSVRRAMGYQYGGQVLGPPGTDVVPIRATAGEYMIRRSAARRIGYGLLDWMNRHGRIPKMARGGLVGALPGYQRGGAVLQLPGLNPAAISKLFRDWTKNLTRDARAAFRKVGDYAAKYLVLPKALSETELRKKFKAPTEKTAAQLKKLTKAQRAQYQAEQTAYKARVKQYQQQRQADAARIARTRKATTALAAQYTKQYTAAQKPLAALQNRVKAAEQVYKDALKEQRDYVNGVTQGLTDYASITNFATRSFEGMVVGMQQRLGTINQFNADLLRLQRMGLNKTTLQEITDAGAEAGSRLAASLLEGGPQVVAQVNTLQKQIGASAKRLGQWGGTTFYQAGVDSAKGILDGLRRQEKNLTNYLTRLGNRMATALKKSLKIKSPSAVFADEVGVPISQGVVAGLDKAQPALDNRVKQLVGVPRAGAVADRLAGATTGNGMPNELVVIDADGALIGRMRVAANQAINTQGRELRLR